MEWRQWRPYFTVLLEAKGPQTHFLKITKIDKIANDMNLPPHIFGDSGRETNNFFYLAVL